MAVVTKFLKKHNIEAMLHSPYSPDLALCDFWLFLLLKEELRKCRFATDKGMVNVVQGFFNSIPKAEFQKTILQHWKQRMRDCVVSKGRYFEKENYVNLES